MYGSSPFGISSAVHTVLAYPKTAITIAMCCAALTVFRGGGTRSEVLDDEVCINAAMSCEEEVTQSVEPPPFIIAPPPPQTSCVWVPKVKPVPAPPAHIVRKRKPRPAGEQPVRKPGTHKHHHHRPAQHHAPAPIEYECVAP